VRGKVCRLRRGQIGGVHNLPVSATKTCASAFTRKRRRGALFMDEYGIKHPQRLEFSHPFFPPGWWAFHTAHSIPYPNLHHILSILNYFKNT